MDSCNECSHSHKEWCFFWGPGEMIETVVVDMISSSAAKD